MKQFAFLALALILNSPSIAQWFTPDVFEPSNTFSTTNFFDIEVISSTAAVAVGEGGIVQRTSDGGTTWTAVNSGTSDDILSLDFADASLGFFGTTNGEVFKTTDAGATWSNVSTGLTLLNINSIEALTTNEIYVTGIGDKIAHSLDGGSTWTEKSTGVFANWKSTSFLNSSLGFIAGDSDKIYYTTDGGSNWTAVSVDASVTEIHKVFARSTTEIYCSAGSGKFFISTNAGLSWSPATQSPSKSILDFEFKTSTEVVGVGEDGSVFLSHDAGDHWSEFQTAEKNQLNGVSLLSPAGLTAIAVGDKGYMYKTLDGGNTWDKIKKSLSIQPAACKATSRTDFWMMGNPGSQLYASKNGGQDWSILPTGITKPVADFFVLGDTIIAVAEDEEIHISLDKGLNWTQIRGNGSTKFTCIAYRSPGKFIIAGDKGNVIFLNNDLTQDVNSEFPVATMNEICSFGNYVYAACENGGIFLTTNSVWYSQHHSNPPVNAIEKNQSTDVLIAVGDDGSIHRHPLQGQGHHWSIINHGLGTNNLDDISYIGNNQWRISADDGAIWISNDDGLSWAIEFSANANALLDISFSSSRVGIAVGENNTVLYYQDNQDPILKKTSSSNYGTEEICTSPADTSFIPFYLSDPDGDDVYLQKIESKNQAIIPNSNLSFSPNSAQNAPITNGKLKILNKGLKAGTCDIVVSYSDGLVTKEHTISINVSPKSNFTLEPLDLLICNGNSVSLTTSAEGGSSKTFQWQREISGSFQDVVGNTLSNFTIANPDGTWNGAKLRALTSSFCGEDTSRTAVLTFPAHLSITNQPIDLTICENENATFSVVVAGDNPSYQWQEKKNGVFVNIPGATNASYSMLSPLLQTSGTEYQVMATGLCNTITSTPVKLTINPVSAILDSLDLGPICSESSLLLKLNSRGTAPIQYKWERKNNVGWYTLSIQETLDLPFVDTSYDGDSLRLIVSGACGVPAFSNTAQFSVSDPFEYGFISDSLIVYEDQGTIVIDSTILNYFTPILPGKTPGLSISLSAEEVTASLHSDYTFNPSTHTINPNNLSSLNVPFGIVNNSSIEPREKVILKAQITCDTNLVRYDVLPIYIEDRDTAIVSFNKTSWLVDEGVGTLKIPFEWSLPSYGELRFYYGTESTATEIQDFKLLNSPIQIDLNDASLKGVLDISIINDAEVENPEEILIFPRVHYGPNKFASQTFPKIKVIIRDNDGPQTQHTLKTAMQVTDTVLVVAQSSSVNYRASVGKTLMRMSDNAGSAFILSDDLVDVPNGKSAALVGYSSSTYGMPVFRVTSFTVLDTTLTVNNPVAQPTPNMDLSWVGKSISIPCTQLAKPSDWKVATNHSNFTGSYFEAQVEHNGSPYTIRVDGDVPAYSSATPWLNSTYEGILTWENQAIIMVHNVINGVDPNWTSSTTVIPGKMEYTATQAGQMYAWYIDGSSYATQIASHQFTGNGNYTVSLTVNNNGCSATKAETQIITALEEQEPIQLKIGPNPTSGKIEIWANKEIKFLRIYDELGRIALEAKVNRNRFDSQDINLPTGVYQLMIQGDTWSKTERLMIIK